MTPPNSHTLETILGLPAGTVTIQTANGVTTATGLTAAQQRAIAPLLTEGVPEWTTDAEYAEAVTFEASRRNDALIPRRNRELLYLTALTSLSAAVDALAAGDPLPQSYAEAKTQGLAVAAAVQANETAAATIAALTADDRPADYLALVAAFDTTFS